MSQWIHELYPSNQNCPRNDFVPSKLINVHQLSGNYWQNIISFSLNVFVWQYGLFGYRNSAITKKAGVFI